MHGGLAVSQHEFVRPAAQRVLKPAALLFPLLFFASVALRLSARICCFRRRRGVDGPDLSIVFLNELARFRTPNQSILFAGGWRCVLCDECCCSPCLH